MNAKKDDNSANSWIGISCVDGITPVKIAINPLTKGMKTDLTTVVSFVPDPVMALQKDDNAVSMVRAVGTDGKIYPVFVNPSNGAVLVSK